MAHNFYRWTSLEFTKEIHCCLYKLKRHIKAYGIQIPLPINVRFLWFRGMYFFLKDLCR